MPGNLRTVLLVGGPLDARHVWLSFDEGPVSKLAQEGVFMRTRDLPILRQFNRITKHVRRFLRSSYSSLPLIRELNRIEKCIQHLDEHMNGLNLAERRIVQESALRELVKDARYGQPKRLNGHEFQVFSQNGEDGITAEILKRIGTSSKTFLEIGVGDGSENNTAYLLQQGWTGWWVEGDSRQAASISLNFKDPIKQKRLGLLNLFVKAESITAELETAGVEPDVDVFCLDVDYNTYWIWKALKTLRPRLAIIEYNSTWPPEIDWVVKYEPDRVWDGSFYYGASLKALEKLAAELNYLLVGCDLSGSNAFFVRKDLCGDHFLTPYDAETHYEPPRGWLSRTVGHRRPPYCGKSGYDDN
jgi:hypothetical protein